MEGDSQLSLHTLTLDNLPELLIYYIYTENLYQFVTQGVDFHGYYIYSKLCFSIRCVQWPK
jgi:hypothetical protein